MAYADPCLPSICQRHNEAQRNTPAAPVAVSTPSCMWRPLNSPATAVAELVLPPLWQLQHAISLYTPAISVGSVPPARHGCKEFGPVDDFGLGVPSAASSSAAASLRPTFPPPHVPHGSPSPRGSPFRNPGSCRTCKHHRKPFLCQESLAQPALTD